MSQPGWYPDPGGSGGFRYWDGRSWSQQISPQPPSGPGEGPIDPNRPGGRRSRAALAIAGVAGLVIVVLVVVLAAFRPWSHPDDITDNPPTVTVSAGDDSTPTPTPTRTPTPSKKPTPSPSATQTLAPPSKTCPIDDPAERDDHPDDGRIHGGHLSYQPVPGYDHNQATTNEFIDGFSSMRDIDLTARAITVTWYSVFAVGGVRQDLDPAFAEPQTAAMALMQCIASSDLHPSQSVTIIGDEASTVGGHPGWTVQVHIDEGSSADYVTDWMQVTVVDTGDPDELSVFVGDATVGDATTTNAMKQVITTLAVD